MGGDSRFGGFARHKRGISMRLALSYAFDWVSLFIVAGIAAALGHIEPHKRPFSLASQDIACVLPPSIHIITNG